MNSSTKINVKKCFTIAFNILATIQQGEIISFCMDLILGSLCGFLLLTYFKKNAACHLFCCVLQRKTFRTLSLYMYLDILSIVVVYKD